MAVLPRRKPTSRGMFKRRPLNFRTLQMMVQSGVVRRADFNPPTFQSKARYHACEDADHTSRNELTAEQGWLARIMLGRRVQISVSKRSWRG